MKKEQSILSRLDVISNTEKMNVGDLIELAIKDFVEYYEELHKRTEGMKLKDILEEYNKGDIDKVGFGFKKDMRFEILRLLNKGGAENE